MKPFYAIALCLHCLASLAYGQIKDGEIANNFTLLKHGTQDEEISLYDYEGHIIVLDFFAYWCGPCQTSSPELETEVAEYFEQQKGNANGVPVTVLAVSIDNKNPGAVDTFVSNAGLKLVGLDETGNAWRQFGSGYIPHFAVVNGVEGSNFEQWEVIHTNYGYRGANFYRNAANQVEASSAKPVQSAFDEWIAGYVANEEDRGAQDDPDGDGLTNLHEYACGTDPSDKQSAQGLDCDLNEDGSLWLTFRSSNSASGIHSSLQYSTNLGEWIDFEPDEGDIIESNLGDVTEVSIRTQPNQELSRFFRIAVSQPTPNNAE